MADFRRWFLAFAALVLVLGATVPASAQVTGPQVSCSVNTAVTPTLRSAGYTELVGDILLVCQGVPGHPLVPAGTYVPQADISVSFGATLGTPTIGPGLDSLLLVDDPPPGNSNQVVCPSATNGLVCQQYGTGGLTYAGGGTSTGPTGTTPRYNIFQGNPSGPAGVGHSITFLGVPVDPPATGSLTYRITNVRIQANSVPGGAFGLTPVYAFVSTSSSTSITITQTTQPIVGYVSPGLVFSATGTNPQLLQCQSYGADGNPETVGTLTFAEGFPNAFKNLNTPGCPAGTNCQTTPGGVYYSESGLGVTLPAGGVTGLATTATELEAVISDVPAGVQISVDTTYTDPNTGITATLISPTGVVATSSVPSTQTVVLAGTGGSVTVVWGITSTGSNPLAFPGQLLFNVYTAFTGAPGVPTGSPTPNVTAYAQGGFYPQEATAPTGTFAGPIPQFIAGCPTAFTCDLSPANPGISLFTVTLCQTILMFPYITDFTGFDTGIAISNTSLDTGAIPSGLGASQQTGTCSVYFYGNSGATTEFGTNGVYTSSAPIAPGETWAFSLTPIDTTYGTSTFTGATGYAIAVCNFQYAHGYTFVSDVGIRNFAAAYLALVIPDAPRSPNPFLCATYGGCYGQAGEQLVH